MRNTAREAAINFLFAEQFNPEGCTETFKKAIYKQFELDDADAEFADSILSTVSEHCDELIKKVESYSHHYLENRMNPMDKSILLMAMAEITYFDDIPPVVSVAEATNIAKKYSSDKSADFVNGILAGAIKA